MNDKIIAEVRKYICPLPKLKLYREVIASVYKAKTKDRTGTVQQLKVHLQDENNKLSKAGELLLCGDIEPVDYRIMKADAEK